MSKLHVSIDHGGQKIEFDSPAGEGNPEISGEDDFGFSLGGALSSVTHAVSHGVQKFAKTASNAAGHAAHSLVHVTNSVTGEVSDLAGKIPVVGKPLQVTIGAAFEPVKFANAVVDGRRIDKAVIDSLKRSVRNAKDIAPYAQLVVSAVPGVGSGLAAGIAAGTALAEGRPINEAVVAAARAAIPGGPLAKAAFDASVAVGSGKSIKDAAVSAAVAAATTDPNQRAALTSAMEIASGVAQGRPIDKVALSAATGALSREERIRVAALIGKPGDQTAVYDALTKSLSPVAQRALTSGLALGTAKESQRDLHAAITSKSGVAALLKEGTESITKSTVLKDTQNRVPDHEAFAIGIGLMRHSMVSPQAVLYLRDHLKTDRAKVSFDSALATHVGAVTSTAFSKGTNDKHKIGFYAVAGSLAMSSKQRQDIVKLLAKKDAVVLRGAAAAVAHVRARRTLWRRFVEWIKTRRQHRTKTPSR